MTGRLAGGRRGFAGLVLALALVASGAAADSLQTQGYALPDDLSKMASVWTGTYLYMFGGIEGFYNIESKKIYRYDPATNTTIDTGIQLPQGRWGMSAVWDPATSKAYLFGGKSGPWAKNEILKFNPALASVSVVAGSTLPGGRWGTSATWDPVHKLAWVFGGWPSDQYAPGVSDIVKFDPATGVVTKIAATLAHAQGATAAVFDGTRYAYVFGGLRQYYEAAAYFNIERLDTATETVTSMANLPDHRGGMSAVWIGGGKALLFGGYNYGNKGKFENKNDVIKFDATANKVTVMSAAMPYGRKDGAALWNGYYAYFLGGSYEEQECNSTGYGEQCFTYWYKTKQILSYTLEPGAPASVTTSLGSQGKVVVHWTPPPANTLVTSVTGYQLLRSVTLFGPLEPLAYVGPTTQTYTDSTCGLGTICTYAVQADNYYGRGPRSSGAISPGWA